MSIIEEKLAKSLTANNTELIPYLPYLLQDLWELGSSPNDIISMMKKNIELSKDLKILDLACGKGAVTVKIAESTGCNVKAIDIMPEFIDFAKKKAIEYGVENNCIFEVDDINKSVKNERNYDVVILGAVGDVLGNHEETIVKLKNIINQNGFIFIDDAYGNGENYISKNEWLKIFEDEGLVLIDEKINFQDEIKDLNDEQQSFIIQRANELKTKYVDKAHLFDGYIESQRDECDELENDVNGVTMLLKRIK